MIEIHYHYRLLSTGPLPVWLGVLCVVVALALAIWLLHREFKGRRGRARSRGLYMTRAGVVAGVALIMLQPVFFIRRDESRPAQLLLVADRSRSMLRSDAYTGGALLDLAPVLPARETLPARVRQEVLNWQPAVQRWQKQVAQTCDELSQGTPPATAFAAMIKEARTQLQTINPKLRGYCDELAKLQAQPDSRAEAQWFAAAMQLLDQLTGLEPKLEAINPSEEQARALLRAHDAALKALNAAATAMAALQSDSDKQLEGRLTEAQRAELKKITTESRFALAVQRLNALAQSSEVATQHTVRLIGTEPLTATNAEDHTDLYDAVQRAVATAGQATIAGIVLASDGQQNLPARPEVMWELASRHIPFLSVGVGLPETQPDVAILNYDLPTTLLAGSRATLQAALKTAVPSNTEVAVTIALKDAPLATKKLVTDGDRAVVSLEFPVPAAVDAPLVLAAKTTQPDGAPNNDQVEIGVSVLPEAARILIIAPAPRWGLVYLLKEFAKTPWRVEPVFWMKGQDAEEDRPDKIPITEKLAQLKNYRLVVLDGKPFDGLTEADVNLLKDYVTKDGGHLVVIASDAGPWYGERLASLIGTAAATPASENSAHLQPTPESFGLPVLALAADTAESLGWWQYLGSPQQVRPVPPQHLPLLSFRQQVCLSLGFYGKGRVYALGCGDLFRLREWDGAPVVNRLMVNLIDDALQPATPVYPPMPFVGSTVRVLSDQPPKPLPMVQAGPVTVASNLVVRVLTPLSLEDVNFGLDVEKLQQIAADAGGHYVALAELPGQRAGIPAQRDLTTTMRVIRLWNLWFLLPLLVALMTLDWVLRRKQGFVL